MANGEALTVATATTLDQPAEGARSLPRRVLERWKSAAHAIGVVQTRMLMVIMYVFMVLPTGLLMRAFTDPLHLKHPGKGNWMPAKHEKPTLENARRQF
jgi:hypothetical protein